MNKPESQNVTEKPKPIDKNSPEEIQKRALRQKIREIKQKIEEEITSYNSTYNKLADSAWLDRCWSRISVWPSNNPERMEH